MTTNARDEKWSEWIAVNCQSDLPDEKLIGQWKGDDGFLSDEADLSMVKQWSRFRSIIAYRYKIKEPESDMHPDLKKIAYNFSVWPKWAEKVQYLPDGPNGAEARLHFVEAGSPIYSSRPFFFEDDVKAARQQLGLDSSGISDPEEEECIQLAYERMNEESVKVSIEELQDNVNKPKHYQLRDGYEVYDLRQDLAAKAANGGATYDQYSDWDRAIEYIVRMWGKNRLEDAKKGRWYLDKLIGKLEAQE